MPRDRMQPISFRLRASFVERLKQEGSELGLSRHEYARHLLLRAIEDQDRLDVLEEFGSLRSELVDVRRDLRTVVKVILAAIAADAADEEQIERYVSSVLEG